MTEYLIQTYFLDALYYMLQSTLLLKNLPKKGQKYEPVLRFLDDWIHKKPYFLDALYYMLQSNLLLENLPKNVQKYEPVLRFLDNWVPNTALLFRCLILLTCCNQLYC